MLDLHHADQLRFANSFNRLPRLIAAWEALCLSGLSDTEWLALLGEHWTTCDNIAQHVDTLIDDTPFGDLLDYPGEYRSHFMADDERALFDALPDQVHVYRGCYAANKWGLSWSLDLATATRFPTLHRYQQEGQPLLVKARAAKDRIVAVKSNRREAEVIVMRPKHVSTRHLLASVGGI